MSESPRGFAIAPNWLVQDREIPLNEKIVYLVLSSHIGDQGTWFMSHAQIAAECGISVASVKRALTGLKAMGVVTWTGRKDPNTGAQLGNSYRLLIDRLAQGELPPSSQGATPSLSVSDQNKNPEKEPRTIPPTPQGGDMDSLFDEPKKEDPFGALFDEVWKTFPSYRRGTKKVARKALATAIKVEAPEHILSVLRQHAADWATWPVQDHQYVPMLSTWLNQERWTAVRPGPRGGANVPQLPGEVESPYGVTPNGRRIGPPPGAHEHPRSPLMGMRWGINRAGNMIFNRSNPLSTKPLDGTESHPLIDMAKRILAGEDL